MQPVKLGQKAVAVKAIYYLLASFRQNRRPNFLAFKRTEKYLCSVLYPKENCNTFNNLRYIPYPKKNKKLWSWPPTSNMSHKHILRSHYVVLICSNLISAPDTNLNPAEFGWNSVDSILMPNKCIVTLLEIYTVTCGCKKKCTGRCQCSKFSASCTKFCKWKMEKNAVPKFTNRRSWSLHKICKYKAFLRAKFSRIWTESKDMYGKYISEKTRIFAFFTQCDAFNLLAQKLTHHWKRTIDMILKITNCEEIFSETIVVIL